MVNCVANPRKEAQHIVAIRVSPWAFWGKRLAKAFCMKSEGKTSDTRSNFLVVGFQVLGTLSCRPESPRNIATRWRCKT